MRRGVGCQEKGKSFFLVLKCTDIHPQNHLHIFPLTLVLSTIKNHLYQGRFMLVFSTFESEDWIPPGFLSRSPTRCHIHPPVFQLCLKKPYIVFPVTPNQTLLDVLWREVHVRHLQIRIVSQGVQVCGHSIYGDTSVSPCWGPSPSLNRLLSTHYQLSHSLTS